MGTKANPGKYDCYAKLEEDEPYFLVKATDPLAPILVEMWASIAELHRTSDEKIAEARDCANTMRQWRANKINGS